MAGGLKFSQLCPERSRLGGGPCLDGKGGGDVVEAPGPLSSSASSTSGMKSYHGSSLEWPLEVDFNVPSGLVDTMAEIVAAPAAAAAEAAKAAAPWTVKERELLPVPYPELLLDRGGETLLS